MKKLLFILLLMVTGNTLFAQTSGALLQKDTALYHPTSPKFQMIVDSNGNPMLRKDDQKYYPIAIGATSGGEGSATVGDSALLANTIGVNNTALGKQTLRSNTTGYSNTAVGFKALYSNTTGNQNVAVGDSAAYSNTTGSNRTAVGYKAGFSSTTTSGGVFLGSQAGYNETAANKLYINNAQTGALVHGDFSTGQVQLNAASTPSLNVCAQFEVISTTRGVLLPRMTKAQRDAISTPLAGLAVYQIDNTPGLRVWNGTNWMRFTETAD